MSWIRMWTTSPGVLKSRQEPLTNDRQVSSCTKSKTETTKTHVHQKNCTYIRKPRRKHKIVSISLNPTFLLLSVTNNFNIFLVLSVTPVSKSGQITERLDSDLNHKTKMTEIFEDLLANTFWTYHVFVRCCFCTQH